MSTVLEPDVDERTEQDGVCHLVCCDIRPPVSFCGTDVSDESHAPGAPITCVVCAEFERTPVVRCPKYGTWCGPDV